MAEDIGYIELTLYQSKTLIRVKSAHISAFWRKDESPATSIRLQGYSESINVDEQPERIVAKIRDINPDFR